MDAISDRPIPAPADPNAASDRPIPAPAALSAHPRAGLPAAATPADKAAAPADMDAQHGGAQPPASATEQLPSSTAPIAQAQPGAGTPGGEHPGSGTSTDQRPWAPDALTSPVAARRPPLRLRRSRDERMIAGVCGGLAESLGVDVAILRLALVLATILGIGAGVVIYVACWILMPPAPADRGE